MASEMKNYPKGQLSIGAGTLRQVNNISMSITNNAQLKHTNAASPSGSVTGHNETSGSFDSIVDEGGLERNYIDALKRGSKLNARLKIPGTTLNADIVLSAADIEAPSDDAVAFNITYIGRLN